MVTDKNQKERLQEASLPVFPLRETAASGKTIQTKRACQSLLVNVAFLPLKEKAVSKVAKAASVSEIISEQREGA